MLVYNDVAVVGMHFRGPEVKAHVANYVPPLTLTLEREPENQFDQYAIKVLDGDTHIGYIESSNGGAAPYIASEMDAGATFTCTVERMEERRRNLHPICTIEEV